MSKRTESLDKLKSVLQAYAIYSGDLVEGEDDKLYFYPVEDLAEVLSDVIHRFEELQEENDRLVGENFRLNNER